MNPALEPPGICQCFGIAPFRRFLPLVNRVFLIIVVLLAFAGCCSQPFGGPVVRRGMTRSDVMKQEGIRLEGGGYLSGVYYQDVILKGRRVGVIGFGLTRRDVRNLLYKRLFDVRVRLESPNDVVLIWKPRCGIFDQ